MSDWDKMTGGERFFLAMLAFLLAKGLIDLANEADRKRIREEHKRRFPNRWLGRKDVDERSLFDRILNP